MIEYEIDGEKYRYNGKKWVDRVNCQVPVAIENKLNAMMKKDNAVSSLSRTELNNMKKSTNKTVYKLVSNEIRERNAKEYEKKRACFEHIKKCGYGYDSETLTYYIHKYIPKRLVDAHNNSKDSQRIILLKEKRKEAVDYYAAQIETFISNYSTSSKKIALVTVPSSNANKKTCIINCLNVIFSNEQTKGNIDYNGEYRELYYYANLLVRKTTIDKASYHNENQARPGVANHIASIECNDDIKLLKDHLIILIDDVSTTGTIMNACTRILIHKGINPANIVRLAMGKTSYETFT